MEMREDDLKDIMPLNKVILHRKKIMVEIAKMTAGELKLSLSPDFLCDSDVLRGMDFWKD